VRAKIALSNADTIRFIIEVDDIPSRFGRLQAPRYLWSLAVDGRQIELDGYSKVAEVQARPGVIPFAVRAGCSSRRGRTACDLLGIVEGLVSVARDTVRIDVPRSMIGAEPGSKVGAGRPGEWRPGRSLMAFPEVLGPHARVPRDDMKMVKGFVVPRRFSGSTTSEGETNEHEVTAEDGAQPEQEAPTACSGITVAQGDDIVAIVNDAPAGSTVCIGAGLYDLQGATLEPRDGVELIGHPVSVGPNGEIDAPSKLFSTAQDGVIRATVKGQRLTFVNLDVSGATGAVECKPMCGRGFNGAGKKAILTVRNSRFHDNFLSGLDGMGWGSELENVELDHNGNRSLLGCCAGGIKSGDGFTIRNSYVHDNTGYGIWCDEGCTFVVEDNLVVGNYVDGIRDELSPLEERSGAIRRNTVIGNNIQKKMGGHGGISAVSVYHTVIENNVLLDNGHAAIEAKDDNRGDLKDVAIRNNSLGGGPLRGCDHAEVSCVGSR
jgi:hypothetical protein